MNVTIHTEYEVNRKAISLKVGVLYLSCLPTQKETMRKKNLEIIVANYNTYLEWSVFTITQDKTFLHKHILCTMAVFSWLFNWQQR